MTDPAVRERRRTAPPPMSREGILASVFHLRTIDTMDLLGQLFGVTAMTISRAKQEVRPLLEAHGHHINTSTARLRTPADVAPSSFPTPLQASQEDSSMICTP